MRAVYPFGLSLRGWRRILLSGFFGLLVLFFLWRVQAILPPFIVAFFVASLLDPIVRYLEKHGRTRVQAILHTLSARPARANIADLTRNPCRQNSNRGS